MDTNTQLLQDNFRIKRQGIYLSLFCILSIALLGLFLILYNAVGFTKLFIGLVGIITIFTVFRNPIFGLYICFFIEFSGIVWGLNIPYGFFGITSITGLSWLFHNVGKLRFRFILTKQYIYIFGFLFFALFSIYSAYDQMHSFKTVVIYLKLLIFYFLITNLITERKYLVTAVKVIAFSTLISVLYGFYGSLSSIAEGNLVNLFDRMRGLTGDPNLLANHALLVLPFFILILFHVDSTWKRMVVVLCAVLLIIGIIASLSRSGIIGLIFVLGYILFEFRRNKIFLIIAGLTILLFIILAPLTFWEHLMTLSKLSRDPSLRWRLRLYTGALSLFLSHPITGIGLGNFILMSNKFLHLYLVAHNTVLEMAVEIGIFGAIMFISIVCSTIQNLNIAQRRFTDMGDSIMSAIAKSFKIGFCGILVTSLFISLQQYFVLWSVFGIGAVILRLAPEKHRIRFEG